MRKTQLLQKKHDAIDRNAFLFWLYFANDQFPEAEAATAAEEVLTTDAVWFAAVHAEPLLHHYFLAPVYLVRH